MKKERIIVNKVILCNILFLLFCNAFGQRINIDSLVNNEYLTFKLIANEKRLVSLEIENTTCDTLLVRNRVVLEQNSMCYIAGYEKRYKNREGKDSIYFQWGALWDYYGYSSDTQFFRLFGKYEKVIKRLPPKTKIITPLTYFNKGEYYLKIQTAYFHRKKLYFARTETNKIKID